MHVPKFPSLVLALVLAAGVAPVVTAPASAGYGDAAISTSKVVVPMTFPVIGPVSYSDTFLACRSGCARKHLGQDLMGPKMNRAVAAFNGVVWNIKRETTVGEGNYITLKGDNGWSANYIHMNNDRPGTDDGRGTAQYFLAPGVQEGKRVYAGELLGWVGDSGNAEGTGPHLHFELRKGDPWSGTVYNAFPSLTAARRLSAPTTSGPHPQGSYVKGCATTCSVWQIDGGQRRLLLSEVAKELRFDARSVVPVTQNETRTYRQASHVPLPGGRAYRGPDGRVWLVTGGVRHLVPDAAALAQLGIKGDRVRPMTDSGLRTVPVAPEWETLPTDVFYDGALLRIPGSTTTWWWVKDGERRLVPDAETLRSWGLFGNDAIGIPVAPEPVEGEEPPAEVVPPPLGATLRYRDGALIKSLSGVYYLVSGGQRRPVGNWRQRTMYAYDRVTPVTPPAIVIARLPAGPPLP